MIADDSGLLRLLMLYGSSGEAEGSRELERLLREYEARGKTAQRVRGVNAGVAALPGMMPPSPARNLSTLLALSNMASGAMGGPTAGNVLTK